MRKNTAFASYADAIHKIRAAENPFADALPEKENDPPAKNGKPTLKDIHTGRIAAIAAAFAVIIGGVILYSSLRARPEPSESGTEANDIVAEQKYPYTDKSQFDIIKPELDVGFPTPEMYESFYDRYDIVMIGEYMDGPEKTTSPVSNLWGHFTYNYIMPIQVFKGEELIKDGKVLIYHNYMIDDSEEGKKPKLYINGLATPMFKGDRALFLLSRHEKAAIYNSSRYPLPENLDKTDRLGFKNSLIDGYSIPYSYYFFILKKCGLEVSDEIKQKTDPTYDGDIKAESPEELSQSIAKYVSNISARYESEGRPLSEDQKNRLTKLYTDENCDPFVRHLEYQEYVITGETDPNATKLDIETARRIINENTEYYKILNEFRKVQKYPDEFINIHIGCRSCYNNGNESVVVMNTMMQIYFITRDSDGNVVSKELVFG